ncbi:MAG: hypothetical protein WC262_09975 [Bacteroidales bacterium]
METTLQDEIGWDNLLEHICKNCKTVTQNNNYCPYEGCEEDCSKVKKVIEKGIIKVMPIGKLYAITIDGVTKHGLYAKHETPARNGHAAFTQYIQVMEK